MLLDHLPAPETFLSRPRTTRWGDYTNTSVDPSFDCTFWYTNEYLQSDGYKNWHTQVASFRFPSCPICVGDCNRNDQVVIGERITAVNILLGNQPVTNCLRADANGDGDITCAEINQGTNNDLSGCPTGGQPNAPGSWQAAPLGVTITQQIGSASGARGSNVTIPVTLTGGGGTISATQLDILYDTAVLGNPSCVKASRLTNHSLSTSLPSSPPPPAGKTRLRTLIIDLNAASTFTDGQTFSCMFTIKTTAQPGTYPITGERQHVSDHAGNEPPSAVANGSVIVL
jgi:hypothetical protein